uniref:HMG box domain-containing protein n=1 Tax=Parascaris univalens TaxID=6257 RepID=A0A915BNT9_PARUN
MSENNFDEEMSDKSLKKRRERTIIREDYNGGATSSKRIKLEKDGDDAVDSLMEEPIDKSAVGQSRISPSQMSAIVRNLSEYVKKTPRKNRRFVSFTDYNAIELPTGVTSEMVRVDIKRYAREATALSSLSLSTVVELLTSFLADGSSVTMDPEFPKKPPSAFNIFIRNSVLPGADVRETMISHSAHWRSDCYMAEKETAEKEALELQKKYLQQLVEYKGKHQELNEAHTAFIDKVIHSTSKMIGKAEGTELKSPLKPKPSSKKAKKTPKTPFELFCMSKADKYEDLDPEKRERKLRRKFDKLGEAEREIYNSLAAAL